MSFTSALSICVLFVLCITRICVRDIQIRHSFFSAPHIRALFLGCTFIQGEKQGDMLHYIVSVPRKMGYQKQVDADMHNGFKSRLMYTLKQHNMWEFVWTLKIDLRIKLCYVSLCDWKLFTFSIPGENHKHRQTLTLFIVLAFRCTVPTKHLRASMCRLQWFRSFPFSIQRKKKTQGCQDRHTEYRKTPFITRKRKKNYVRLPLKTHSTHCDNIKLINDEIRRRAFLCVGFISTVCGLVWRGDSAISNEICIACRMHHSWGMSESCDKRINLLALYLSRNAATNVFLHNNVKHTDHFVFKTCLFVATKKMNIFRGSVNILCSNWQPLSLFSRAYSKVPWYGLNVWFPIGLMWILIPIAITKPSATSEKNANFTTNRKSLNVQVEWVCFGLISFQELFSCC